MKTVKLIDQTLTVAAKGREDALTFKEKLEMARSLDRLKVDAVELPPVTGLKADQLFARTVAGMVSTALTAVVGAGGDVEAAWEGVRSARHPRLCVTVPCSPVQMEYSAHMKTPALLAAVGETVRQCRFHCEDVEVSCADATRAERDTLAAVIRAALEAGAVRVTLCDTAGEALPDEFAAFLRETRAAFPDSGAEWYVQVSDSMHIAAACAAAAVTAGADGVKCAAVAADTVTLGQMADFLRVRGQDLDLATGLRVTELNRTMGQIERLIASGKAERDTESGAGEDNPGICLDSSDEIGDVVKVVRQLGYDLSDEDNAKVYEAFKRVAVKKSFVGAKELDVIVATTAMQAPSAYRIDSYVINSGNVITATANITLEKDGGKLRGVSVGDGPIDAAFQAIEQIIGHHYELDDFQIQAVTEGREAMGSALVKLRSEGRLYSGNGISTDIIGAAIRAYISALNKIVYEEA